MKRIKKHLKHHFHFWILVVFFLVAASLFLSQAVKIMAQTLGDTSSFSTTSANNTNSATITPTCEYTCEEWSNCNSNGVQTCLVFSKSPSVCAGGHPVATSRTCAYTPPACTYFYSSWEECQPDGYQYRSVTKQSPAGCTGTPILRQSCNYHSASSNISSNSSSTNSSNATSSSGSAAVYSVPACAYTYGEWQSCQPNGFQYRSFTAAPAGCVGTPDNKRSCVYAGTATTNTTKTYTVYCAYECSPWSACNSAGFQTRNCKRPHENSCVSYEEKRPCAVDTSEPIATSRSISPTKCAEVCSSWSVCSPNGIKTQTCIPSAADCVGEKKVNTASCIPTICKFNYSAWSQCFEGFQYRLINESYPFGCVGGDPQLIQSCAKTKAAAKNADISASAEIQNVQPENVLVSEPFDPDIIASEIWREAKFKTLACPADICGGEADPDKDGLSNNDEYRFGADPLNPDSDKDGKRDGEEVAGGTDPLRPSTQEEGDEIFFESAKEGGIVKPEIYKVLEVEMITINNGEKGLLIAGKGPASSYVTVYIYSDLPIILTIKTDSQGNWRYVLEEQIKDGNHEIYVAVTDNTGKIKSKSEPLPFVKIAQAATIIHAAKDETAAKVQEEVSISITNILLVLTLSFLAVIAALILIGLVIKKTVSKISLN